MTLPNHLDPANGPVAQRADGRWFITLGNPGFNCAANNASGFASRAGALSVMTTYTLRGQIEANGGRPIPAEGGRYGLAYGPSGGRILCFIPD